MPPSQFRDLVEDPTHESKDYILDHPEVKKHFSGAMELGGGMVVHFG
jgi:hypothetical protein